MIFRRADKGKERIYLKNDILSDIRRVKQMSEDLEHVLQNYVFFIKDTPFIMHELQLLEHTIYMFRRRLVKQGFFLKKEQ